MSDTGNWQGLAEKASRPNNFNNGEPSFKDWYAAMLSGDTKPEPAYDVWPTYSQLDSFPNFETNTEKILNDPLSENMWHMLDSIMYCTHTLHETYELLTEYLMQSPVTRNIFLSSIEN